MNLGRSIALAAAFAVVACSKADNPGGGGKAKVTEVPVTTAAVVRKSMPVRLSAIGTVEASTTVAVKARMDGQITAVRFADGAAVARGQVLFELDDRALRAQLAQAQAVVQRDRAQVANLKSREERFRELVRQGFYSADAYEQVRADLDAARATLAADEAAVAAAQVQLSYARITAPVAGRASRALIQVGNAVKSTDPAPLTTIATLAPAFVAMTVPERELPGIRAQLAKGPLPVVATLPDASRAEGRLDFIDNMVDRDTGTVRLRATFPNRDEVLWPGQFVRASVTLREQPDAVVVPGEAVQAGPKGSYVFVVKPDRTAELRIVKVDRTEGADTVIAEGLAPGESVVTAGQIRVTPGAKLAPKQP